MDAAAELVGTLADEGVQHLFINPGTDSAPPRLRVPASTCTMTACGVPLAK